MPLLDEEQETKDKEQDYFDSMSGQGMEDFNAEALGTAYLGMVQPDSKASLSNPIGTFFNTATGENYGKEVEVIPLQIRTAWIERSKDTFMTVGRYIPKSIPVDIEYPKAGQRGFPKMTNPATGNEIKELFVYALVIKSAPDSGILYFSPTPISMSTCKTWNRLMYSTKLASGKTAPCFRYSWILHSDEVPNPANPNKRTAKFVSVTRGELNPVEWFKEYVEPQLTFARDIVMLAAPEEEVIEK